MKAVDFMMACVGSGILLVCLAWSIKILTDTRARIESRRDKVSRKEEPLDPLGQQLHEFRNAQFGRPMAVPIVPPHATTPTWPVGIPKLKGPIPKTKKENK